MQYRGYKRIMEHKMETTTVYGVYIGIMEMKLETTQATWRVRWT